MMRKLTETNQESWNKWTRFIELAYNSRIHSTTKYSPFEIMFGRKMNTFDDWESEKGEDETAQLIKRSVEINDLINTREKAIDNIEKAQERQKEIQNNRNNVVEEQLKIGTAVRIKVDGIKNKLDNKYRGKFYIESVTEGGNYKLRNAIGIILRESYPLNKLKPIEEDEGLDYEVEKVLNERKVGDNIQYLVKFKNYDEPEWIDESNMDANDLINAYHRSKLIRPDEPVAPIERNLRRSTRTRRTYWSKLNYFNTLFCVLFICLKVCFATTTYSGKFKFCETGGGTLVDRYENCLKRNENRALKYPELFPNRTLADVNRHVSNYHDFITMYIIDRMTFEVFGTVHQCKKEKQIAIFEKTFLAEEIEPIYRYETIILSKEECMAMKMTKMCEEKEMICVDDICTYDEKVKPEYKWFTKITKISYKCTLIQRYVQAEKRDAILFATNKHDCNVQKEFCVLHDTTIVWDKNEIQHTCPYRLIDTTQFVLIGTNIMKGQTENIVFEIIDKIMICSDQEVYSTSEGLFLQIAKANKLTPFTIQTDISYRSSIKLLLAEGDNTKLETVEMIREMNLRNCFLFSNMMNIIAQNHDKFIEIMDLNKNNIVLYAAYGELYIANCRRVDKIILLNETEHCFEDIPILLNESNKTTTAYLVNRNIIRKNSRITNCKYSNKYILMNNNEMLKRRGNLTYITKSIHPSSILNIMQNNISNLNFKHNKKLLNGVDPIVEILKTITVKEVAGEFFVSNTIETRETREIVDEIDKYIKTTKKKIYKIFIIIIASLILILFLILIIYFTCKCKKCVKRRKTKKVKMAKVNNGSKISLDEVTKKLIREMSDK